MSSPISATSECVICGDPAPLTCAGCQDATYCTLECQRTDEKIHKVICSSFKDFATPPKPNMHRGLLFEADKTKPRFVWFEFTHNEDEGEVTTYESIRALVGGDIGIHQLSSFNPVRNRKIGKQIEAIHLESFAHSDMGYNQCLGPSVVGACKRWYGLPLERTVMPFYGNVLCIVGSECDEDASWKDDDTDEEYLGEDGSSGKESSEDSDEEDLGEEDFELVGELNKYYDLNSADFRNIADYFSIASPAVQPIIAIGFPHEWKERAQKLKGVRIHCVGDEEIQYTATSYPQDHPFPGRVKAAGFFGCQLVYYEVADDLAKQADPNVLCLTQVAFDTRLVITTDSGGRTTKKQVDHHVVRKDGKDLLPQQLEAICAFLRCDMNKIDAANLAFREGTYEQLMPIRQRINPSTWGIFWEDFKTKRGLGDEVDNPAL